MFERFDPSCRQVVVLAQQQARQDRRARIEPEYLLLGILAEGTNSAARALIGHGLDVEDLRAWLIGQQGDGLDGELLATIGIDLAQVRQATESRFGPGALAPRLKGPAAKGHIPFSAQAKNVIESGVREAQRRHQTTIRAGHLLLGLIDDETGPSVRALQESGLNIVELRGEMTQLLESEAA